MTLKKNWKNGCLECRFLVFSHWPPPIFLCTQWGQHYASYRCSKQTATVAIWPHEYSTSSYTETNWSSGKVKNWVRFWYRNTPIKSKVKSGCKSCDTHTHTHARDSLCSQSVFCRCFSPTHHLSPRQGWTALQSSDQSEMLQHSSWLLENESVCAAAQTWLSESPNLNLNWKFFSFFFCQFSSTCCLQWAREKRHSVSLDFRKWLMSPSVTLTTRRRSNNITGHCA